MDKSLRSAEHRRLCQLLRDLRRRRGLSQADVAGELGTSQAFISRVEAGEVRLDLLQLRQVLDAMDADLVAFVEIFMAGDGDAARLDPG